VGPIINSFLIILVLLSAAVGLYFYFRSGQSIQHMKEDWFKKEEHYDLDFLIEYIKEAINDITRTNLYELGLDAEEFKKRVNKRTALKKALRNCTFGSLEDKTYVKDFIFEILQKTYLKEDIVNLVIPFHQVNRLTYQDKFDIILYLYKKKYQYDALSRLIKTYHLDRPKSIIEQRKTVSYIITKEELEDIFEREYVLLSYEDKLHIIVQRIYERYKGFGVIDEIRDMNIDGVSGGVSGVQDQVVKQVLSEKYANQIFEIPKNYDSVWIFYEGKSIHLSFLSFGSNNELRRVCLNIYRYNKAGQLSESTGYKINEMKDGSRVVVVRPSFSESWSFFVRKFHLSDVTLEDLIKDNNKEIAIGLIQYLVKGAQVMSITGAQGSGKTTLLMAMIRHIYGTLPLRIQETAFELHLRRLYPMRNILSFQETDYISGQAGLDLQKKTDGSVNILGEVATDPVAAWMIQMAQVASLFTLFTHHARTVKDLVMALRNSLLKCEIFNNEKVAEQQVVQVLNFDIHLERDYSGKRYIERITEIIPLDQDQSYPTDYRQKNGDGKMEAFMDSVTEYFTRVTDRKQYIEKNIIEFVNGGYQIVNVISDKSILKMKSHMTEEDIKAFDQFLVENWGG
jgi:pilus assembly protein CpaF